MNKTGVEKETCTESTFPVLIKLLLCCMFPNADSRMGAISFLLELDRSADLRYLRASLCPNNGQCKVLCQEPALIFSSDCNDFASFAKHMPPVYPENAHMDSSSPRGPANANN